MRPKLPSNKPLYECLFCQIWIRWAKIIYVRLAYPFSRGEMDDKTKKKAYIPSRETMDVCLSYYLDVWRYGKHNTYKVFLWNLLKWEFLHGSQMYRTEPISVSIYQTKQYIYACLVHLDLKFFWNSFRISAWRTNISDAFCFSSDIPNKTIYLCVSCPRRRLPSQWHCKWCV